MTQNLFVIDHPLVQHKLSLMRRKDTSTGQFRQLMREISPFMLYEATRDLPLAPTPVETVLGHLEAPMIEGKKLCLVPILRAGLGFVDAMLDLVPSARVGHIGLYREPETLVAVEYYMKLPEDIAERRTILLDPLLATGHSASAALSRLKEVGVVNVKFVCLIAARQGIETVHAEHPEVPIYTAAIDPALDAHGYIVPGLGDAGDRLFGTK
ncbi:MAG TPA: uracil phosphoribosyltransferase [Alphaproteobacteria bacterium]|nr:uracil phosphoribosyltransferase [Alphaproteobacteria bacterium]